MAMGENSAADAEELRPLKQESQHDPELGVAEPDVGVPRQWSFFPQGSGQLEYQGFETWTDAEKQAFRDGKLKGKWGILQVSIRLPVTGWQSWAAIIYGYLPYAIPLWWAFWAFGSYMDTGKARFFPKFGLIVAGSFALVNETVTKQICKRVFSKQVSSRPPEAVCKHPGMPSGHVMNAYTLMIWCLWEAALEDIVHLDWLFLIVAVMGPVPWARVYNKDHTLCQVLVSAVAAVILGSVAYYIRSVYFPFHENPWDWYSISALEIENAE